MTDHLRSTPAYGGKLSLRQMMIVFLLVISGAVTAVNGWIIWNSWNSALDTAKDNAHNLAQSLSRQAEDAYLQVDLTLQDLRDRIKLIGLRHERNGYLQSILTERKAALPQLSGIFIYDAAGNWVVTSDGNIPQRANNGDRNYFRYHATHDDPGVHIGTVIRSRSSGRLVIPVSMRLNNDDGSFRGVVMASVSLDFFRTVYDYYNLGRQDVLALMQNDGTILYLRPFLDSAVNQNIASSPLFTRLLKDAPSGTAIYKSALDGVERVFGYASLPRYPLVVAAGYAKQPLMQAWFPTISVYIALCTILLLLLMWLGLLLLRHISLDLANQQELTRVRDKLTASNHTLQSLALIDSLTGLANRRHFDLWLQRSIERSQKLHTPLALMMIDVDAFKAFNDRYGHPAGDACLTQIASALSALPHRSDDLIARYGGEEFAVIMPGCSLPAAAAFARRAIAAIAALQIPHGDATAVQQVVTISVGLQVMTGGNDALSGPRLVAEADNALYAAKRAGKNRLVIYGDEPDNAGPSPED